MKIAELYFFYLMSFVMSAFLAHRFFGLWIKTGKNQSLILKNSILFFIGTIIFLIAAFDSDHSKEWLVMILCCVGIGIFLPEVLPKRDIWIICVINFFIFLVIGWLYFFW